MKFSRKFKYLKNGFKHSILCIIFITLSSHITAKEFKVISLEDFGKIKKIKFQDESSSQILSVEKYHSSRNYPFPKNDVIHFYGINFETGISSRKPLFKVSFENQETDLIIFLKLDVNNPGKIAYELLSNDPETFPFLSSTILNLSNRKVVAKIGREIISFSPNERKTICLPSNQKGYFNEKAIFAQKGEDEVIQYFYSSFWRIPKNKKTICIIYHDNDSNAVKLKEILL